MVFYTITGTYNGVSSPIVFVSSYSEKDQTVGTNNLTRGEGVITSTASASGSGVNLSEVLKNVFQSLINAVTKNVKPDLNPNEKGPVYTIIDSSINLVVTIIDKNNLKTIIPMNFNINTKNLLSIGSSATRGSSGTLSATSASISGTLGQLLLLLDKQIPTIIANTNNVDKTQYGPIGPTGSPPPPPLHLTGPHGPTGPHGL